MRPLAKYLTLCSGCGAAWGLLVTGLAQAHFPHTIWGGMFAAPLIGALMGLATLHWCEWKLGFRIGGALVSLYASAALFGLAVGLYDWLVVRPPDSARFEVVLETVFGFVVGLTILCYWIVLWPLAYLTCWLTGRVSPAR